MHRSSRYALASLTGFALLLTGCSAPGSPDAAGSSAPSTPSASAPASSPSPSPTPETHTIEISVDGVSVDGGDVAPYDDADAVVQALTDALGAPTETTVDAPYGGSYPAYDWEGLRATDRESRIDLRATANQATASFITVEGVGIGSTRAEAMAAGAEDEWDDDGDGIADYLKVGMREVPGTTSLVTGQVGMEYVSLTITDDVVTAIMSGANDFSDL